MENKTLKLEFCKTCQNMSLYSKKRIIMCKNTSAQPNFIDVCSSYQIKEGTEKLPFLSEKEGFNQIKTIWLELKYLYYYHRQRTLKSVLISFLAVIIPCLLAFLIANFNPEGIKGDTLRTVSFMIIGLWLISLIVLIIIMLLFKTKENYYYSILNLLEIDLSKDEIKLLKDEFKSNNKKNLTQMKQDISSIMYLVEFWIIKRHKINFKF